MSKGAAVGVLPHRDVPRHRAKITIRNLDFWYPAQRVSGEVLLDSAAQMFTELHRRQVRLTNDIDR